MQFFPVCVPIFTAHSLCINRVKRSFDDENMDLGPAGFRRLEIQTGRFFLAVFCRKRQRMSHFIWNDLESCEFIFNWALLLRFNRTFTKSSSCFFLYKRWLRWCVGCWSFIRISIVYSEVVRGKQLASIVCVKSVYYHIALAVNPAPISTNANTSPHCTVKAALEYIMFACINFNVPPRFLHFLSRFSGQNRR